MEESVQTKLHQAISVVRTLQNLLYHAIRIVDIQSGIVVYSNNIAQTQQDTEHMSSAAIAFDEETGDCCSDSETQLLSNMWEIFQTLNTRQQKSCLLIFESNRDSNNNFHTLLHKMSSLMIEGYEYLFIDVVCYDSRHTKVCPVLAVPKEKVLGYCMDTGKWQEKEPILLTKSENLILKMSLRGLTSKEMANITCCSEETIRSQKKAIYSKLGVRNLTEAVAFWSNYNICHVE